MSTNKSKTQAENPEQTGIQDQAGNPLEVISSEQAANTEQADSTEQASKQTQGENPEESDNQKDESKYAHATTPSEQSVQFINQEVLNQKITPITGMAKPLVDQAAAMMVQDMQSFLQGNEQILTVAIGKAISYTLEVGNTPAQNTGKDAIKVIEGLLENLNTFSTNIGKSASTIASDFNG